MKVGHSGCVDPQLMGQLAMHRGPQQQQGFVGFGGRGNAFLGNGRGLPTGACCPSLNAGALAQFAAMDPRAAAAFGGPATYLSGQDDHLTPAESKANVGQTFGAGAIPLYTRAEASIKMSQVALLHALGGGSTSDIVNMLGKDNPGSQKLASSIMRLANALKASPQNLGAIRHAAQSVHYDMIGHTATNAEERQIGKDFFKRMYGVSRPGEGTYRGRGGVGNIVNQYAPAATNPRDGEFVTADPSQSGQAALQAAKSQIGVREASGNNDGIPSQRFSGGRNQPWCADFVSWSFRQSGHPLPGNQRRLASVSYMESQMKQAGKYHQGTPKAGDIIFFQTRGTSDSGPGRHVGIVDRVENGRVYTVEGNSGNSVRERSYPLDSARITGYGRP